MTIQFENPVHNAAFADRKKKIYGTLQEFAAAENKITVYEPMEPSALSTIKLGEENSLLTDRMVMCDVDAIVGRVREAAGLAIEAMAYGDKALRQKNRKAENAFRTLYENAVCNMFVSDDHVRIMRDRCMNTMRTKAEELECRGLASRNETNSRRSRMHLFMERMLEKYQIPGIDNQGVPSPKRVTRTVTSWNMVVE